MQPSAVRAEMSALRWQESQAVAAARAGMSLAQWGESHPLRPGADGSGTLGFNASLPLPTPSNSPRGKHRNSKRIAEKSALHW